MKFRIVPIYSIFLVMGFGDLIGPLASLVRQKLVLTQFEASLIAFAGFIMFGTLSVPAGFFQEKYGKKITVTGGLLLVLAGLIAPLMGLTGFLSFLLAVSLLGAGATVLQVSGSPLLHSFSSPGSYARNLTFAQFIKGIGTLSSPLIPYFAFRYFNNRWEIVFLIFAICTFATLLFFLITAANLPSVSAVNKTASFRSMFALLAQKDVAKMVLAIFLYVGAEVCMSVNLPSFLILSGYQGSEAGMAGIGMFFLSIMGGRFAGSVILKWLSAEKFFLYSCFVSLVGLLLLSFGKGLMGYAGAFITGFGFSNIFPLVFSIAIEKRPTKASELSGLMITAIAGGAIVPAVMGLISDAYTLQTGVLVPVLCVMYLIVVALQTNRSKTIANR